MELPHLGKQCAIENCLQKNDYLILKCTFCKLQFCNSHSKPRESQQESDVQGGHFCHAFPVDARTIQCPVCNQIIPVPKGNDPDLLVNDHISKGCVKGKEKKIFTNQCGKKGCLKKELVPMECKICKRNFCIKHRLETDHECPGPPPVKTFWDGFSSDSTTKSGERRTSSGKQQKQKSKSDCILQ